MLILLILMGIAWFYMANPGKQPFKKEEAKIAYQVTHLEVGDLTLTVKTKGVVIPATVTRVVSQTSTPIRQMIVKKDQQVNSGDHLVSYEFESRPTSNKDAIQNVYSHRGEDGQNLLLSSKYPSTGEAVYLISPIQGLVLTANANAGDSVTPGATLFEIADVRRLSVSTWVRVTDARMIRPGMVANIYQTGADQPLPGIVKQISSVAVPSGNAVLVPVIIDLPPASEGSSMFINSPGTVEFKIFHLQNVACLPLQAVHHDKNRNEYYVSVLIGSTPIQKTVETGPQNAYQIQIRSGLEPRDKVIISNRLADELAVKASSNKIFERIKAIFGKK